MKTARETVEKQGAIPGDGNDVAGLKTGAGVDTAGGEISSVSNREHG